MSEHSVPPKPELIESGNTNETVGLKLELDAEPGLSRDGRIGMLVIVTVICVGVLASVCQSLLSTSAQDLWNDQATIQALYICWNFMLMLSSSLVIPESYALAVSLGRGPASSGALIGASNALRAIGAFFTLWLAASPWNQSLNRRVVLYCGCLCLMSAVLYGVAAHPPQAWNWTANIRFALLMGSRVLMGIPLATGETMLRIMAQRVTPSGSLISFSIKVSFSDTMGIGLGPLLSAAVGYTFGLTDVRARSAFPVYALAGAFAILVMVLWLWLPTHLTPPSDRTMEAEATPGVMSAEKISTRQAVIVQGMFLIFGRAVLVSALEAASALILGTQYAFSQNDVGLSIAATFLVSAGLMAVLVHIKQHLEDDHLVTILTTMCTAATFFLFKFNGFLGSYIFFLSADSVIFQLAYFSSGIVEGRVLQNCVPGTWSRLENFAVFKSVITGTLGRFVAPSLAQGLVAMGGRNAYAAAQLVLAVTICLGMHRMNLLSKAVQHDQISTPDSTKRQGLPEK